MLNQIKGLHHVTSMAAGASANNAFFTDDARPAPGQEDRQLRRPGCLSSLLRRRGGTPGSVMTYFPFPHIARGRQGAGEVGKTVFAVPKGALPYWEERLAARGVADMEEDTAFGARRLRFTGPDGDGFALVEATDDARTPWTGGGVPEEAAIRGFHGASLRLRDGGATAELLQLHGLRAGRDRGRCHALRRCRRQRRRHRRHRDAARRARRRTGSGFGAPHRLRGARPGGAARGAQGADATPATR